MDNQQINYQINIINNQIIDPKANKLLLIIPESAGDIFLFTSLLDSLRSTYKDYHIYVGCKASFMPILKYNPNIDKIIEYLPVMDTQILMEGTGKWKGLFDISIMVTVLTQRFINYLNNGKTRIALNLKA